MANQVSPEALSRGAVAAFGGSLQVGLLAGDFEEMDAGYERRPVVLVGPERDPDGSRVMVNDRDVIFPPYERMSLKAIDGWALYDGGTELVRGSVLEPRTMQTGDQFIIRAGMLRAGFGG